MHICIHVHMYKCGFTLTLKGALQLLINRYA